MSIELIAASSCVWASVMYSYNREKCVSILYRCIVYNVRIETYEMILQAIIGSSLEPSAKFNYKKNVSRKMCENIKVRVINKRTKIDKCCSYVCVFDVVYVCAAHK